MTKLKALTEGQLAAFSPWPVPAFEIRRPPETLGPNGWEFNLAGVEESFRSLGIVPGQCAAIIAAAEMRDRYVGMFQHGSLFNEIAVQFVPVTGGIGDEWMVVAQRGKAIYHGGDF
jgi:hypothetical protein